MICKRLDKLEAKRPEPVRMLVLYVGRHHDGSEDVEAAHCVCSEGGSWHEERGVGESSEDFRRRVEARYEAENTAG